MKIIHKIGYASRLAVTLIVVVLMSTTTAVAAEIKVLCATPVGDVVKDLGAKFQKATGHKLDISFDVSTVLIRRIEGGEAFDMVILLPGQIESLTKLGKLVPGSAVKIAKSGLGVGVRTGVAKPDIRTVDSFRTTLRATSRIAYSQEGQSGVHFMRVLDRLGLAEELKSKLVPLPGSKFATAVPNGEAEMIVVPISSILAPGMDLVGPVPEELQNYFVFTGAIAANAREPEATKAMLKFLIAPEHGAVLKAKGMEPAAP